MIFRIFAACALLGALVVPAAAYLDPGAGSFALQMLLAGALAVAATGRVYWYRAKTFVARLLGRDAPHTDLSD
jgi:hypothetical protein